MAGPDDILYEAGIDDKTGAFFDKFDKNVDKISAKAASKFAGLEGVVNKIGPVMGFAAKAAGGLVTVIGGALVAAAGTGIAALSGLIQQGGELRAQADVMAFALEKVAENAGYTKEQMENYEEGIKKASFGTIEARQALSQMIKAELDLSKSSELATVAQDAAVLSNISGAESLQRIIRAIQTASPLMLKTLGLSVDSRAAMEKYAASVGKAANKLTLAEKQQALMNAVLDAGKPLAGAFAASLDAVGMKRMQLEQVKQEILLTIGAINQPTQAVWLDAMTKELEKVSEWLKENEDLLIELGEKGAAAFGKVVSVLISLVELLAQLPDMLDRLVVGFADLITPINNDTDDLRERLSQFPKLVAMFVATWVAGFAVIGNGLKNFTRNIGINIEALKLALSGDFEGSLKLLGSVATEQMDVWQKAFGDSLLSTSKFLGIVEETGDKVKEQGPKYNEAAAEAAKLSAALKQADDALREFYNSMQEDIQTENLKKTRQAIEDELKAAWDAEDRALEHKRRVDAIMKGADDARTQAMQTLSQRRIDIERDYRRRVRDIQRNFEYEAEELARARDAVGLLRLMRQKKRELAEAKIARNDARQDAQAAYQLELQRIDQQRKKQLEDLAEQERLEEESRQRSLDRQRILQELHDKWEKEDRERKYAKQLSDLITQMGSIEGITSEALDTLLGQWSSYFGSVLTLAQQYQAQIGTLMQPGSSSTGLSLPSGLSTLQLPPMPGPPAPPPVVGQAGLVSSMLANPASINPSSVSRLPAVVPPTDSGRSGRGRVVDINLNAPSLEPVVQRILVQGLLEIERNRGSILRGQ